jgi:hypothetical protein
VLGSFSPGQIASQDQELRVHHLHALVSVSQDPSYVLLTSLDTILHDKSVCCGKDSALEGSLKSADPKSLKDVASKLDGRHLLSDGRPIKVTTEYLTGAQASGGHLVTMIKDQHPALMEWNSHLYVVHGVDYFWQSDGQGGTYTQLHKILLWDTRYSDARREVTLTVGTEDAGKVEGILFVQAALQ